MSTRERGKFLLSEFIFVSYIYITHLPWFFKFLLGNANSSECILEETQILLLAIQWTTKFTWKEGKKYVIKKRNLYVSNELLKIYYWMNYCLWIINEWVTLIYQFKGKERNKFHSHDFSKLNLFLSSLIHLNVSVIPSIIIFFIPPITNQTSLYQSIFYYARLSTINHFINSQDLRSSST